MQTLPIKRLVILLSAVIVLAVVIYLSTLTIGRSGKTAISLSTFPEDSHVTIDGKVTKPGTTHLTPGTYRLEANKEGYDSFVKTLVVNKDSQTVAVILTPNSEEAFKYGRENEAEYRKVQAKGEIAAAEAGRRFSALNPITKHLPYKTFFYSIGYRMDQTDPSGNSIIIEIDALDPYKQAALYRIRQLGYDPTDFIINFRNYENPFPL